MEQVGHDSTDQWSATEPSSIGNLVSGFSLAVLEQVLLCLILKCYCILHWKTAFN